jgi:hypothetical protein
LASGFSSVFNLYIVFSPWKRLRVLTAAKKIGCGSGHLRCPHWCEHDLSPVVANFVGRKAAAKRISAGAYEIGSCQRRQPTKGQLH